MSELDPVDGMPVGHERGWWDAVYGPLDPLGAQWLEVTWRRVQHGRCCPCLTNGTPYDCTCWHRAQAIVAASLLRDEIRDGRWT